MSYSIADIAVIGTFNMDVWLSRVTALEKTVGGRQTFSGTLGIIMELIDANRKVRTDASRLGSALFNPTYSLDGTTVLAQRFVSDASKLKGRL